MTLIRTVCLCLFLGLFLPAVTAAATDPAALQSEVDAKVAEIDALRQQVADAEQAAATIGTELDRLRDESEDLEQRRSETLAALEARFERVIEDPTMDLAAAQQAYRDAFETLAANRANLTAKARELTEQQGDVATARDAAAKAGAALTALRAQLNRARFERLVRELNVVGEITLTSTITCEPDETIAGCIARGEDTARELARTRFRDQVLAAVTEADVAARHGADDDALPTLIRSEIQSGGFRGQGDYVVELSAELRNEIDAAQACRLLGLTEAECRGDATAAATAGTPAAQETAPGDLPQEEAPEEIGEETAEAPADSAEPGPPPATDGQLRLTVRSNVYYDEVYIDGVPYGSTKLDVLLPPGEYDLEVRKPGHSVYRERIALNDSRTVTATLYEQSE
jgi:hypothetical protein